MYCNVHAELTMFHCFEYTAVKWNSAVFQALYFTSILQYFFIIFILYHSYIIHIPRYVRPSIYINYMAKYKLQYYNTFIIERWQSLRFQLYLIQPLTTQYCLIKCLKLATKIRNPNVFFRQNYEILLLENAKCKI